MRTDREIVRDEMVIILECIRIYYYPNGDEESTKTDDEFDESVRLLYRTMCNRPLEPSDIPHYHRWCRHMTRVFGFGFKSTRGAVRSFNE